MKVPLAFQCEKCGHPILSEDRQSEKKVVCPQCGYENTPPQGFGLPDSATIAVKNRYFPNLSR